MKLIHKEKKRYKRGDLSVEVPCYTVEIAGLAREEIARWCEERKMDFWCSDQDFMRGQARIWAFTPKQEQRVDALLAAFNPPPKAEPPMPLSRVDDVLFASVVQPWMNGDKPAASSGIDETQRRGGA